MANNKNEITIILDLLKELKDDHKELSKTSSKHREETLQWQAETSSRLNSIEVDLREHKEGVINNRELIRDSKKRLELLEQPKIAAKTIKNYLISTGKIGTAIIAIYGFISWVLKNL